MAKGTPKSNKQPVYTHIPKVFHGIIHQERVNRVIDMFVEGKGRPTIKKFLMEEWEMSQNTANTLIEEALIYLNNGVTTSKESIKTLNYIRLENIMEDCTNVGEKLKTIDLINKTYGVYEQNLNINGGDNTFKFDIGVDGVD